MSDHKLLKVIRYSKSFKQSPRFVRKRMFKTFDEDIFRKELSESKLDDILATRDVNEAAELLVAKMTKILDRMAPIKTIQTRSNYAPWLGEETKKIKKYRETAQEKAWETGHPDDWRQYRAIRNKVTARSRVEKKEWEKKNLDHTESSSTDIWKTVRQTWK